MAWTALALSSEREEHEIEIGMDYRDDVEGSRGQEGYIRE